jgi:hypothetical protein
MLSVARKTRPSLGAGPVGVVVVEVDGVFGCGSVVVGGVVGAAALVVTVVVGADAGAAECAHAPSAGGLSAAATASVLHRGGDRRAAAPDAGMDDGNPTVPPSPWTIDHAGVWSIVHGDILRSPAR